MSGIPTAYRLTFRHCRLEQVQQLLEQRSNLLPAIASAVDNFRINVRDCYRKSIEALAFSDKLPDQIKVVRYHPIMRILILHNRYKLHGGEDVVVQQESQLLRDAGYFVDVMEVSNDEIESGVDKLKTAFMSIYSPPMRKLVERRIQDTGANVLHVHNFFPRLTPSVYDAGAARNCAVVQTLHNYRLVCPGGLLFRDGAVCEECLGRSFALPGVQHGCYRDSRIGSATIATMTALHRARGTWRNHVDRYIVLNEYARSIFTKYAGLPPERIRVKPNVVPDSGLGRGSGDYALFVGRLSPEKGIATLLRAASDQTFRLPLKIVGTGPMQPEVIAAAASCPNIEYLGAQSTYRSGQVDRRRFDPDCSLRMARSRWPTGHRRSLCGGCSSHHARDGADVYRRRGGIEWASLHAA